MILKKKNKFLFVFNVLFVFLSYGAKGDILEKYLKKDSDTKGALKLESTSLELPTRPGRKVERLKVQMKITTLLLKNLKSQRKNLSVFLQSIATLFMQTSLLELIVIIW